MKRALLLFASGLFGFAACTQPRPSTPVFELTARPTASARVSAPPGPTGVPEASAAPAAAPSSAASSQPPVPPADLPIPPAPPGVDPKHVEYLGSICPLATMQNPGQKVALGCRGCPPHLPPDGKIEVLAPTYENSHFCQLLEAREGSFTKPGAKQVLLAMESPFMVMSTIESSAVVVEYDGKRWRTVSSSPAKVSDSTPYRRDDGIDMVLGSNHWGAYHEGGTYWFYAIDFTKPEGSRTSCFGKVAINTFAVSCNLFGGPTGAMPFSDPNLTDFEVKSIEVADIDGDAKPDFVARVAYLSQPNTKALHAKIHAGCQGREVLPTDQFLPPLKNYTLVWRYDGSQFLPTPATRKLLEAWKNAGPRRWYVHSSCRGV